MREEFAPRCISLGHFLLEEYKLYVPNGFAAFKGIGLAREDSLLPRENGLIPNENSIRISVPEGEKEIDMEEKINQLNEPTKKQKVLLTVRRMVFIALLGALAAVLMILNFPLPFMPPFLKFDVSDMPALFACFYLGPISGAFVSVIKVGLELLLVGTDTAFVGELSNLTMSLAFTLTAGIIYRFNKTKKGALIGLICATAFVCALGVISNKFVMLPLYVKLYGLDMEAIVGMCSKAMPAIKDEFTLLAFGILPFNIIKFSVTSLVTFLIYKKLGKLLSKLLRP